MCPKLFIFREFYILILKSNVEPHYKYSSKWVTKIIFGNSFCFLFSKTCFWEYKEKTIFLYFWNKKYVWLVEIKKYGFLRKKIENTKIYCY